MLKHVDTPQCLESKRGAFESTGEGVSEEKKEVFYKPAGAFLFFEL